MLIRISKLTLKNVKNVGHGEITFTDSPLLGIYGQNGTGKSAAVFALDICRQMLSSTPLSPQAADLIAEGSSSMTISCAFKAGKSEVEYAFTIGRDGKKPVLLSERIALMYRGDGAKRGHRYTFSYDNGAVKWPLRKAYNKELLKAVGHLAQELCGSFFFHSLLVKEERVKSPVYEVIQAIAKYAREQFFVVNSNNINAISYEGRLLYLCKSKDLGIQSFFVKLYEKESFTVDAYKDLKQIVDAQNIVLAALVPDLRIVLNDLGPITLDDGQVGVNFEMLAERSGKKFPLHLESEGIKKLLSVLSLIICSFNEESSLLAIDELDSGIFEYLLGQLLSVLEKQSRGQLLFTAHNLRPMELLSTESVVVTTTNTQNRFIRLSGLCQNNNMRSTYIRTLQVGGQDEELYDFPDEFSLGRSFRKAWR